MKSINELPSKAKISILVGAVLVSSLTSVALFNGLTRSESDLPSLQQQVQHNTEQLNNHEARISNAEGDIKQLQNSTNTDPAADRTPVPPVSSQPTTGTVASAQTEAAENTPAPTPAPVVQKAPPKACDYPTAAAWGAAWDEYMLLPASERTILQDGRSKSVCTTWTKQS